MDKKTGGQIHGRKIYIEMFLHPESHSKISNLMITKLFYRFFLIWPKVPSYKKSQVYIFLDDLKMALWDRKVSNTFKKQTPDKT